MNKVILIGRLGKAPECKTLESGKKVCSFSMATSKKIKGEEKTEWHNIVLWNKTAELAEKYTKKGNQVMIEGEITTRSWEDKEGNKKYTTEIVGNNIMFLDKKESNYSEYTDVNSAHDLPF